MLMNKKGVAGMGVAIIILASSVIVGSVGNGIYETSKNGILKRNGNVIWCKMQNKGEQFCNQQYGYQP